MEGARSLIMENHNKIIGAILIFVSAFLYSMNKVYGYLLMIVMSEMGTIYELGFVFDWPSIVFSIICLIGGLLLLLFKRDKRI